MIRWARDHAVVYIAFWLVWGTLDFGALIQGLFHLGWDASFFLGGYPAIFVGGLIFAYSFREDTHTDISNPKPPEKQRRTERDCPRTSEAVSLEFHRSVSHINSTVPHLYRLCPSPGLASAHS